MSCHEPAGALVVETGSRPFTVALAGNPNVGKSSLFNLLTGLHQRVGNWPGKTVERRDGFLRVAGRQVVVTDLPGSYSLSPHTLEESVTREFLVHGRPDLILNTVDALHLERNLYLTVELLELGIPMVVVLTMTDAAQERGVRVDVDELALRLGVPVVSVVASSGQGLESLLARIEAAALGRIPPPEPPAYLTDDVERLVSAIAARLPDGTGFPRRWAAVKVVEQDPDVLAGLGDVMGEELEALRQLALSRVPDGPVRVADERYAWIAGVVAGVVGYDGVRSQNTSLAFSDRVDLIITHRLLGPPLTAALLAAGIWGAFRAAAPVQDLMDTGFTWLGRQAAQLAATRIPPWAVALLTDGIINGVATVAAFAPLVAAFFLFMGLLEYSGYFARAAFVLDRFLSRFGLQGRTGIGLLIGYGCNVPSVMAARTAASERSRLLAILAAPLVICSARLVVIGFLSSVFAPGGSGAWMMMGIYALGVALVLGVSRLFSRTLLKGEDEPFLIELPPYRLPGLRNVGLYAWQQTVHFLRRAATVIAPMTVVVWAISYLPYGTIETSLVARLGQALEPLGRPLGLDWRLIVSLFPGFLAKEATLSTLAVLFASGSEQGLAEALRSAVTLPQALAYLVFYAFYTPCLATATTIYQQTRSWRWTAFSIAYSVALSAILAFLVFQGASRLWPAA